MPEINRIVFSLIAIAGCLTDSRADMEFSQGGRHLRLALSQDAPAFSELQVDSLGGGRFSSNPVVAAQAAKPHWKVRAEGLSAWVYSREKDGRMEDSWRVELGGERIILKSRYSDDLPPVEFELRIDQKANHTTLLALPRKARDEMSLPAVMHFPDQGSLRITGTGTHLTYQARRRQSQKPANFVRVGFPAATRDHPQVEYQLEVAAIHPALPGLDRDPLYDGFRRNFLNIFQWNPRLGTVANNSSSDVCGFVFYEYAEVAARAQELASGLHPMDLIRISVDRVLDGGLTYGQPGYKSSAQFQEAAPWSGPHESLDLVPSILWSGCRYALVTRDKAWALARYADLANLTKRMLARDRDGDGLIEYEASGNSGSWPGKKFMRPSNWWDTIGFGHEDAYSNAIAHRALRLMAELATWLEKPADAENFTAAADRLKASYLPELFNPETGLIAGWKSADGKLHDYQFTFINGMAVSLGLVEGDAAKKLMTTLMEKISAAGYSRFDLGLPGNLVPVAKADYVDHDPRFGGGVQADGSDGFQTYINGGATACHTYWTIHALYQVGMTSAARQVYRPLLKSFEAGVFQGVDEQGKSRDWKDWRGNARGYEGFLVDSYLALIAVEDELAAGR